MTGLYPNLALEDLSSTDDENSLTEPRQHDAVVEEQFRILRQIQEANESKNKFLEAEEAAKPSLDAVPQASTHFCEPTDISCHPNTTSTSGGEDEASIGSISWSSEMIEEQARILEQIRLANEANAETEIQRMPSAPYHVIPACGLPELTREPERAQSWGGRSGNTTAALTSLGTSYDTHSSLAASSTVSDTLLSHHSNILHSQDRVTRLANGRRLKIRGTVHAAEAAAQGKAVFFECPHCQTMLQISRTSKRVFCTVCQTVTRRNTNLGQVQPRGELSVVN